MSAAYIAALVYGKSVPAALTESVWTGFGMLLVLLFILAGKDGRLRMSGPIALWTTFFMAIAPMGPAAAQLEYLSIAIGVAMFIALGAIAYLMERTVIGDRCGTWYVQYGLMPIAILWGAGTEVSGDHVAAGAMLILCWLFHLFYKWLPEIVDRLCFGPERPPESG